MKISSSDYDLSTATWHKSTYSGGSGGDCLEVATWRKSTYSGGTAATAWRSQSATPASFPSGTPRWPTARRSCSGPPCGRPSSPTSSTRRFCRDLYNKSFVNLVP